MATSLNIPDEEVSLDIPDNEVSIPDSEVSVQQQEQPSANIDFGKVGSAFMKGASPNNPTGGLFGGQTEAATELYSQEKDNLLNLLSAKGILPDSIIAGKKVPVARTAASILTDLTSGMAAEASVNVSNSLLKTAGRALESIGNFLTKPSSLEQLISQKQALENTTKSAMDTLSSQKEDVINGARDFLGGNKDSIGQTIPGIIQSTQLADETALKAKYLTQTEDLKNNLKVFSESSNPGTESIPNSAHKQTLDARSKVPIFQNKINTGFGKDIEAAYGNETIDPQNLASKLEGVLQRARIISSDSEGFSMPAKETLSSSEKAVKSYYEGLLNPDNQEPLKVGSVDQDLRRIFQVKSGKPYGAGEHILTDVRQALMEDGQIWGDNKDIQIVRSKWKPQLQAKAKSYQVFDPYNRAGANETTKGVNFFSRYAEQVANPHSGTLGPDEVSFVNTMKKEFGKNVFSDIEKVGAKKSGMVSSLKNMPAQYQAELSGIQSAHAEKASEIARQAEVNISQLDSIIAKKSAEHTVQSSALDELINRAKKTQNIKRGVALVAGGVGADELIKRFLVKH